MFEVSGKTVRVRRKLIVDITVMLGMVRGLVEETDRTESGQRVAKGIAAMIEELNRSLGVS